MILEWQKIQKKEGVSRGYDELHFELFAAKRRFFGHKIRWEGR